MLGFIYVSIFCIYTLHITYLYFNSWQCLTLTVILWNFWIIWIVWQWWIGVFKWLKSGPGVDTQYLVTSLRQLIHLSAAFSSPLLWPKWWYFSFRKHLMLWNSFQICVEKDLVVWSSSETFRNSKTRKERQGHPKKHMRIMRRLAPRFALRFFVGSAAARFAITVMSHFRHSWCIEISCLLGRFSLDASKGTWRMMWRQDSSSHCFWNLSVWMSKHAQVAQLVGYVSENAAYHHGEMSLVLPSSICVLKGSPGWILKAKQMLKLMDVMMSLTNASIFPVSTDLILVCWHLGRKL